MAELVAGSNVTLTPAGATIIVASTAGAAAGERRHDWVTNTSYVGVAAPSTADSAGGWQLTKIVVSSSGGVTITKATDTWNNHLTATYT